MALNIRPRISPERTVARRPLGIMTNQFLEKPILNSPCAYSVLHWRVDKTGQPSHQIINKRRPAEFTILKVDSSKTDEIACWFIDVNYNEEIRATPNSDTSLAFDTPESGRAAVNVVNHLGDQVIKVFRVV